MLFRDSDLNLLILKYLEENGFKHSVFNFLKENNLQFNSLNLLGFPPGLLVSLVQRGLVYSEIECKIGKNYGVKLRSPIENFLSDIPVRNYSDIFYPSENKTYFICSPNPQSILNIMWNPRFPILIISTSQKEIFKVNLNHKKLEEEQGKKKKTVFLRKNSEKITSEQLICFDVNLTFTLLAGGTENGFIYIYSETFLLLRKKFITNSPIIKIKWSENSRLMVILCKNNKICIHSVWKCQNLLEFYPSFTKVSNIYFQNNYGFSFFSQFGWLGRIYLDTKVLKIVKISSQKQPKSLFSYKSLTMILHFRDQGYAKWNFNDCEDSIELVDSTSISLPCDGLEPFLIYKNSIKGQQRFLIITGNKYLKWMDVSKFSTKIVSFLQNSACQTFWDPEGKITIRDISGRLYRLKEKFSENSLILSNLNSVSNIRFSNSHPLLALTDLRKNLFVISLN